MRKLVEGDIDMGIVGYDLYAELAQGDDDLTLVHDALDFGHCRLSVAVPQGWAGVDSLQDLRAMGWSASEPLRVVTGYLNLAQEFFEREGFEHVQLTTADGALEAAPAMGTADAILDLVSSGTTLRENNLKELKGGTVVESEGVLIASRRALLERPDCLEVAHEMVERFDAHLRAQDQYLITANTRGSSAQEVADKLNRSGGDLLVGLQVRRLSSLASLNSCAKGLTHTHTHTLSLPLSPACSSQGPTISPIYSPKEGGEGVEPGHFFAVNIVVPRKSIFDAVKLLRQADGSGVCVAPITYIYDEEPPRWRKLVDKLGLPKEDAQALSRA